MSNKKYKLLKDLPDARVGIILTMDKEDNDTYDYTANNGESCWYRKSYVEENSDWFGPIEEIEVDDLVGLLRDAVSCTWGNDSLEKTQEMFDDFLEKRNLKPKDVNKFITKCVNEILLDKKYTQEQYDKAISDAFCAGREKSGESVGRVEYNDGDWAMLLDYKYPLLGHYLNHIKKQK